MERDPGELYRVLGPAVLGYLRAQRISDPEDLLHDVFLQVSRDIRTFSGDDGKLRSWVFAIARNRLLDSRRRASVRPQTATGEMPDLGYMDQRLEGSDEELIAACGQLTDDQREVIVLRFVCDLPLGEVARLTGRRVGAVKRLQARGLARLAELLDR